MAGIVRHRQTKGPATDRSHLKHRATPRLHTLEVQLSAGLSINWICSGGNCGKIRALLGIRGEERTLFARSDYEVNATAGVALTHQGGRNEIFERKVIFAAIFGVDRLRVVTFAMGQAHPHQVDLGTAHGSTARVGAASSPVAPVCVNADGDNATVLQRKTSATGFYRFSLLRPGQYDLKVEGTGFKALERKVCESSPRAGCGKSARPVRTVIVCPSKTSTIR